VSGGRAARGADGNTSDIAGLSRKCCREAAYISVYMLPGMRLRLICTLILSLGGCVPPEDEGRIGPGSNVPGSDPWNHDDQVACDGPEDCGSGEACEDGVCQMARCQDAFASIAPLGHSRYFGTDAELAIISDGHFIDAFEAGSGYLESWDLPAAGKIVDVAAGALTAEKPHTVAVAIELSDVVELEGPGASEIAVGLWPRAIAAGDVDADGLDELVAFSEAGEIAVCSVEGGGCARASIDGVSGVDVAVADIDGDGYDEVLALLDHEGASELVVWNLDAADTGQEESYGWSFDFPVRAMSAGRISGSPTAEVALLEDGGWWGWSSDQLHVFAPASESIAASVAIDGYTVDVAVGDRDSDDHDEIAVLRDSQIFEVLYLSEGTMYTEGESPIPVGEQAERISFIDWNGDSAVGQLVAGPELVAGDAVPIAVLMFPPYPHDWSGDGTSSVTLGDKTSVDETHSDTLSLGVGMGLEFGAEAFGFKAKVKGSIEQSVSWGHSLTTSVSVGARYGVSADPDLHGKSYAPVVMACGCYHRYRYLTDDPAGLIGGSGQTVDIYVPVGGQTQLWSSTRYNAMAAASGKLPLVNVPFRVGAVESYPTEVATLDGLPIAGDDMLFPNTPTYQASDVGEVAFWLERGDSETNSVAESTSFGVGASFGAGGVSVDAEVSVGVEQGYSLSVGASQLFAGSIPPVLDDHETPEDEFALHRFAFRPVVYRHHYVDRFGADAAFYVLHHQLVQ
jgi:hypothetical protein